VEIIGPINIPGLANHQLKNKQMKNTFTIPLPLKLLVCTTIFGFTTSFCQNVNGHSKEKQLKSSEHGKPERSSKKPTITTEPYKTILFDSCRMEEVELTGQVVYRLTESFDKGYYIDYRIDLDKISGIGKKSGTIYHGGGKIEGVVKQNEDGSKVKGKTTYKVKYVGSNGNQIFFNQNARFIMVNGETKVDFNDVYDSCR
jgi:hypothetical protein